MSAAEWIAVGLLGGVASVARYVLAGVITAAAPGEFPLGTLVVNLAGSFVLGLLAGLHVHGSELVLLGTATLGSFTTFSTWMLETERLARYERLTAAAVNVSASLACGVAAVALGRLVG